MLAHQRAALGEPRKLGDDVLLPAPRHAVRREHAELGIVHGVRVGEEDEVGAGRLRLGEVTCQPRDQRLVAGAEQIAVPAETDQHIDDDDRGMPCLRALLHAREIPDAGAHHTRSSRGFGRSARPTLAQGRPSSSTTSAVKSTLPSRRLLPTP